MVTATTEVSEFAKDETHKKPQYWLAVIKNGQIVVGQPLTFTEAVNMAYTGYDIIAANQDAAKLIAQTHRICIKDEKMWMMVKVQHTIYLIIIFVGLPVVDIFSL